MQRAAPAAGAQLVVAGAGLVPRGVRVDLDERVPLVTGDPLQRFVDERGGRDGPGVERRRGGRDGAVTGEPAERR